MHDKKDERIRRVKIGSKKAKEKENIKKNWERIREKKRRKKNLAWDCSIGNKYILSIKIL